MFKGILFLLSFPLNQHLLAYPRRHRIAKNIRHETRAKDHPCRHLQKQLDRPFPVLASLQELLVHVQNEKQHIVCRMDPKRCSDSLLTIAKGRFTTYKMSALCGEEILYDISLVLEHFYREFTMRSAELDTLISKQVLERNDTLKSLLDWTLNHIRDAVMSIRSNATDPFIAIGNVHKVKRKVTEMKLLRKYVNTILDFEHFVKSAVSIIKLE